MRSIDVSSPYWLDCDRRIAIETHYDKAAARALNADWLLVNVVPFGSVRPRG